MSSQGRNYPNKEKHEKNGRHPLHHRSRLVFWRYGVQRDSRRSSEVGARGSGEGAPASGTEGAGGEEEGRSGGEEGTAAGEGESTVTAEEYPLWLRRALTTCRRSRAEANARAKGLTRKDKQSCTRGRKTTTQTG